MRGQCAQQRARAGAERQDIYACAARDARVILFPIKTIYCFYSHGLCPWSPHISAAKEAVQCLIPQAKGLRGQLQNKLQQSLLGHSEALISLSFCGHISFSVILRLHFPVILRPVFLSCHSEERSDEESLRPFALLRVTGGRSG